MCGDDVSQSHDVSRGHMSIVDQYKMSLSSDLGRLKTPRCETTSPHSAMLRRYIPKSNPFSFDICTNNQSPTNPSKRSQLVQDDRKTFSGNEGHKDQTAKRSSLGADAGFHGSPNVAGEPIKSICVCILFRPIMILANHHSAGIDDCQQIFMEEHGDFMTLLMETSSGGEPSDAEIEDAETVAEGFESQFLDFHCN